MIFVIAVLGRGGPAQPCIGDDIPVIAMLGRGGPAQPCIGEDIPATFMLPQPVHPASLPQPVHRRGNPAFTLLGRREEGRPPPGGLERQVFQKTKKEQQENHRLEYSNSIPIVFHTVAYYNIVGYCLV